MQPLLTRAELGLDLGARAEAVPTPGNPVVFGTLVQDPKFPTVTIYNHLDVQPADPLTLWQSPPFTLTPATSIVFGNQSLNIASTALPVTVTNTGTSAFSLAIALTGTNATQFSQSNTCGTSLPAGASCTVNVVFKPTSINAKSAALAVTPTGGIAKTVALSGSGIAGSLALSPTAIAFGTQARNTTSAPQTVTVTNTSATASVALVAPVVGNDADRQQAIALLKAQGLTDKQINEGLNIPVFFTKPFLTVTTPEGPRGVFYLSYETLQNSLAKLPAGDRDKLKPQVADLTAVLREIIKSPQDNYVIFPTPEYFRLVQENQAKQGSKPATN